MTVYLVLLHLVGAVILLLWAVRMVRTGIERSYEPALRRILKDGRGGWPRAAAIGGVVAALLQSSTAVAVLASGFAGTGVLTVASNVLLDTLVGTDAIVTAMSYLKRQAIPDPAHVQLLQDAEAKLQVFTS